MGAGASANCLPVVTGMPQRLQDLIETIQLSHYQLSGYFQDVTEKSNHNLRTISSSHASIGIFAKNGG